ncbi:MAG: hypothetical protein LRY66_16545 [Saccharospirillaceae bacterium]|nr:hypothetical protein [Saccharospirillaceae bacterium]MCD8532915.1 hypothetical protein [Saccharospirillaceae bacterium]
MMMHKNALSAAVFMLLSAVAVADGQDDIVDGSDRTVLINREHADPHEHEVDSLAFGNYYRMEPHASVQDIIRAVGEPVGSSAYIPRQDNRWLSAEKSASAP